MKPASLYPVGSPGRVRVTKVVRTQYRLEWEYDRLETEYSYDPEVRDTYNYTTLGRGRKVRFVASASVAYRMAAVRLIMCRRDRYATEEGQSADRRVVPKGCLLCDRTPGRYIGHGEYYEAEPCKYHGGDGFYELIARLARWLRWRDGVIERDRAFRRKSRAWFARTPASLPDREVHGE